LEGKLEKDNKLQGQDSIDYPILLRHKVCVRYFFSFFISSFFLEMHR
jgi:hypothetical protein